MFLLSIELVFVDLKLTVINKLLPFKTSIASKTHIEHWGCTLLVLLFERTTLEEIFFFYALSIQLPTASATWTSLYHSQKFFGSTIEIETTTRFVLIELLWVQGNSSFRRATRRLGRGCGSIFPNGLLFCLALFFRLQKLPDSPSSLHHFLFLLFSTNDYSLLQRMLLAFFAFCSPYFWWDGGIETQGRLWTFSFE